VDTATRAARSTGYCLVHNIEKLARHGFGQ
jgi:hypothetical protein